MVLIIISLIYLSSFIFKGFGPLLLELVSEPSDYPVTCFVHLFELGIK